jgi:group I intron endonuclease
MVAITCIYKIQSKSNPKRVYIGSALSFNRRKNIHLSDLRRNKHHSKKLQRHYNKYGLDDLDFEIIEAGEYAGKQHLLAREQGWYEPFSFDGAKLPYFNSYLIAGSSQGCKHSEEDRRKQSERQKGIPNPRKGIPSGIIPWNKGLKGIYSQETRDSMALGRKGKPSWCKGKKGCFSEDVLKKMKKPKTEEHKRKLSLAHLGVPLSAEHTKHAKEARKKTFRGYSDQTLMQMSESQKGEKAYWFGKKQSKESNEKRSISLKKTWAKRKKNNNSVTT